MQKRVRAVEGAPPKLRRQLKGRTRAQDHFVVSGLGAWMAYARLALLWLTVVSLDLFAGFRFETLWPFWLFVRASYEAWQKSSAAASAHAHSAAVVTTNQHNTAKFSILFVCATATSDLICYLFIPVKILIFLASTYVWLHLVWHTNLGGPGGGGGGGGLRAVSSLLDRSSGLPVVALWAGVLLFECLVRSRCEHVVLALHYWTVPPDCSQVQGLAPSWARHLNMLFGAHSLGFPFISVTFSLREHFTTWTSGWRREEVARKNELLWRLQVEALPAEYEGPKDWGLAVEAQDTLEFELANGTDALNQAPDRAPAIFAPPPTLLRNGSGPISTTVRPANVAGRRKPSSQHALVSGNGANSKDEPDKDDWTRPSTRRSAASRRAASAGQFRLLSALIDRVYSLFAGGAAGGAGSSLFRHISSKGVDNDDDDDDDGTDIDGDVDGDDRDDDFEDEDEDTAAASSAGNQNSGTGNSTGAGSTKRQNRGRNSGATVSKPRGKQSICGGGTSARSGSTASKSDRLLGAAVEKPEQENGGPPIPNGFPAAVQANVQQNSNGDVTLGAPTPAANLTSIAELNRIRSELRAARSQIDDTRLQLIMAQNAEKSAKQESALLKTKADQLESRLAAASRAKDQDRSTIAQLERRVTDQTSRRDELEKELAAERRARKEEAAAAAAAALHHGKTQKMNGVAAAANNSAAMAAAQRELALAKEREERAEHEMERLRTAADVREEKMRALEMELLQQTVAVKSNGDLEALTEELALVKAKCAQLEDALRQENTFKQQLFKALGEAREKNRVDAESNASAPMRPHALGAVGSGGPSSGGGGGGGLRLSGLSPTGSSGASSGSSPVGGVTAANLLSNCSPLGPPLSLGSTYVPPPDHPLAGRHNHHHHPHHPHHHPQQQQQRHPHAQQQQHSPSPPTVRNGGGGVMNGGGTGAGTTTTTTAAAAAANFLGAAFNMPYGWIDPASGSSSNRKSPSDTASISGGDTLLIGGELFADAASSLLLPDQQTGGGGSN